MSELNEVMRNAKYLIVDDEISNVKLLQMALKRWGCLNIKSTTQSTQAASLFEEFEPDLVLLDLMMPDMDGFGVMKELQPLIPAGAYVPILVLTSDITLKTKRKALAAGARDFLTKPIDTNEFLLRVSNLLETRALHLQVEQQKQRLEHSQHELVERLSRAITLCDTKQDYETENNTGHHAQRVGQIAKLLAEVLQVPPTQAEMLGRAARLHDVGRIGISDEIVLKPGKLTAEEMEVMKTHTTLGSHLLAGGEADLLQMAERIARTHHERWDGTGYPQGLSGEDIPLEGRIVAVAEVFDALTHRQPYREAWEVADAVTEIQQQSGRQFDPAVIKAFMILPHRSLI